MQETNSNNPRREKSFHRYAYTLFSTVCKAALGVITSIVVPRALGPTGIGTIAFGQIIVQNVKGLFDFNISQTFFNLSVEKRQSGSITRLFLKILSVQFILTVIVWIILGITKMGNQIIQGSPLLLLLILLVLEWSIYAVNLSNQLGDSKGISKWPQIATLVANLFMTIVIVILAILHKLTIWSYIVTMLIFSFLNLASITTYLLRTNYDLVWTNYGKEKLKSSLRSIMKISLPLTIAGYYGMGIEFFERFLIQYQYGAEEQAYFHIASRWAALIILFSTSSLQIFWQHLIETISAGNLKGAENIYLRLDGVLFYFTLCLALIWSSVGQDVLTLLLGGDFMGAGAILTIMAFYPVAQVFGQLGNTIAIASGRTKELLILYMITSTVGLVVSYFILVPKTALVPGLGLGGIGLGIKTAIFGVLMVQPLTFANCRYLSISYSRLILSKLKIFMSLIIITSVLYLIGKIWVHHVPALVESSVRAILFLIAAITLLLKNPEFCGIYPEDLERLKNNFIPYPLREMFRLKP